MTLASDKNFPPIYVNNHHPPLVAAGVVKDRRPTSYWHDGVPEEIAKAGGQWVDEPVVVDGNLITARYPMDLPFFMKEVLQAVKKLKA